MASGENSQNCDTTSIHSSPSPGLPPLRIKKEEPMDDYGEGLDKKSRIAHLKTRLIECEQRAKKAEEELAQANEDGMGWMVKNAESERSQFAAEEQLLQLQKEKEEAERIAEEEKAVTEKFQKEVMKKYENALAWKGRMKEELEQSKTELEMSRNEWNGKLDEMARVANLDKAESEKRLKEMKEKSEADLEKAQNDWNEKLDKMVRVANSDKADYGKHLDEMNVKYEADLEKAQNDWNGKLDKIIRGTISDKSDREKSLREMKEKYESALLISRENEKLVEEMKIEKMSLEEEVEKTKADLAKARSDWHETMQKLILGEKANNESKMCEMREQYEAELEKVRKEWNEKLEESEKARLSVEESLKKEREERSNESREAWKRQAELKIENEDLQEQVKRLKEQLESDKELIEQKEKSDEEVTKLRAVNDWAEQELKDVKAEAAEAKLEHEKLRDDLEEMRKMNGLLATTPSGKIHDELMSARKQIEHLEKEVEAATPKVPERSKRRKRRPEDPSETVDKENTRRSSRNVSKPATSSESVVDSVKDEEPPVKRTRVESVKKQIKKELMGLQCIHCEECPETGFEYAWHLRRSHNSSLEENGIFLLCSCGYEVRVVPSDHKHSRKCNGRQFTITKLDEK